MSSTPHPAPSADGETDLARALRIARERVLLDEARADLEAGDLQRARDWLMQPGAGGRAAPGCMTFAGQ